MQELDREWEIERILEANAATVSLWAQPGAIRQPAVDGAPNRRRRFSSSACRPGLVPAGGAVPPIRREDTTGDRRGTVRFESLARWFQADGNGRQRPPGDIMKAVRD